MIPHEIAALADALQAEFDIDRDHAIAAAYRAAAVLKRQGVNLT